VPGVKDEPSFLYSVAVAATGFLFSLLLAVGVFFLQRKYSARDRQTAEQEERRAKLRDELSVMVQDFSKVHPSILLSVLLWSYMAWRVLRFRFALMRFAQRTDDEELKKFCVRYNWALQSIVKHRTRIPYVQAHRRAMAVFQLSVLADIALTAYLLGGAESVNLAPFDAAQDGHGGRLLNNMDVDWAGGAILSNREFPEPTT
jgi:hypothetical protein